VAKSSLLIRRPFPDQTECNQRACAYHRILKEARNLAGLAGTENMSADSSG
jgi:hypothetical protein